MRIAWDHRNERRSVNLKLAMCAVQTDTGVVSFTVGTCDVLIVVATKLTKSTTTYAFFAIDARYVNILCSEAFRYDKLLND